MSRFQFNVYLPVSDYTGCWDTCADDAGVACDVAANEMTDALTLARLPRDMKISAKFVEFDGENEDTANGIYRVTVTFNTDTMSSKDLCTSLRLSLMMEAQ